MMILIQILLRQSLLFEMNWNNFLNIIWNENRMIFFVNVFMIYVDLIENLEFLEKIFADSIISQNRVVLILRFF